MPAALTESEIATAASEPAALILASCRCGQPYRPPTWGRSFACAVCGALLSRAEAPATGRRSLRLPAWRPRIALRPVPALVTVVVAAGVTGFALRGNASARPRRLALDQPAPPQQVVLPPQMRECLEEKLRLQQEDLQQSAGLPIRDYLLRSLGWTHIKLWCLLREEDPTAARRHRAQAEALVAAVRDRFPELAKQMTQSLNRPGAVPWVQPQGVEGRLPGLMPGGMGRLFPARQPLSSTMGAPGPVAVAGPSEGFFPGGSGEPGVAPGNAPSQAPTRRQTPSPISSDAASGNGLATDPGARAHSAAPAGTLGGGYRSLLRMRLQDQPNDIIALHELAMTFEAEAGPAQLRLRSRRPEERASLEQAALLYQRGLRASRLRVHRAAFAQALASVLGRLGRRDEELAALYTAVEAAPYHAYFWSEIQGVTLALGKRDENARAREQLARWRLPLLQIDPMASPAMGASSGSFAPPATATSR